MNVIKSFNREQMESHRQAELQIRSTKQQMETRKISFLFEGLKTFMEQIGTVLIIILTVYCLLSPGANVPRAFCTPMGQICLMFEKTSEIVNGLALC